MPRLAGVRLCMKSRGNEEILRRFDVSSKRGMEGLASVSRSIKFSARFSAARSECRHRQDFASPKSDAILLEPRSCCRICRPAQHNTPNKDSLWSTEYCTSDTESHAIFFQCASTLVRLHPPECASRAPRQAGSKPLIHRRC